MDYGELLDLLKSRRSVRRFSQEPLPQEDLEKLIEAARWAPSNHNRQGWKFVALTDHERIRDLAQQVKAELTEKFTSESGLLSQQVGEAVLHATLFAEAPCVLLVMHKRPTALASEMLAGTPNPELISGEPLSAAMAVQNLLLAAHALGLGACMMTAPLLASEAIRSVADLPPGLVPTCLVAVGYPAETPEAPRRKRVDQILEYR